MEYLNHDLEKTALSLLEKRGVTLDDIADLVYFLQSKYHENLSLDECKHNVERVLTKREIQNAIITGIELDILAEQDKLQEPLLAIIKKDEGLYGIDEIIALSIVNVYGSIGFTNYDEGLYGIDEIIALSIVNVYGSIGFTNYGYIDKLKPGILERLNDKSTGLVNTFLDDIVGAIAAAASSRLAHRAAHKKADQIKADDE